VSEQVSNPQPTVMFLSALTTQPPLLSVEVETYFPTKCVEYPSSLRYSGRSL